MKNRIYGLETEYAIKQYIDKTYSSKRQPLSESDLFQELFKGLDHKGVLWVPDSQKSQPFNPSQPVLPFRIDSVFLVNAARFYMDSGGHPEYTTPECLTPNEAVIHDLAGEQLLNELAKEAEKRLTEEGYRGTIFLCKNNVDSHGTTYGCHENYLISRQFKGKNEEDSRNQLIRQLTPFLVARQVLVGAGKIFDHSGLPQYQVSQRAEHIEEHLSSSTTSKRGIINLKDEPLALREKYRRLHLIVGDSNRSPLSTWLKLGLTGIVLKLIENDSMDFYPSLCNPVESIRDISKETEKPVLLDNGAYMTALDILDRYMQAARRNPRLFQSAEERALLDRTEKTLQGLRNHDPSLPIDQVIKRELAARYLERKDVTYEQLRQWHPLVNLVRQTQLEFRVREASRKGERVDDALRSAMKKDIYDQFKRSAKYADLSSDALEQFPLILRVYLGLRERDLRYHDIRSDEKNVYNLLQKEKRIPPLEELIPDVNLSDVSRAREHAPSRTRAAIRETFVRWVHCPKPSGSKPNHVLAGWDNVTINGNKYSLPNPFRTTPTRTLFQAMNS